ncbi:MAG: integrin alpha [Elainellaceae cyanobacterium]
MTTTEQLYPVLPGTLDIANDISSLSLAPLALASQTFTQNDLPGTTAESNDFFGTSLVSGNFNGDSYSDLIIGTEFENLGSTTDAGGFHAVYGFFVGLTSLGSQFVVQDDLNGSASEAFDYFASSLAAGDFDGDGYDDLAIGADGENWNFITDSGSVNVAYGSTSGLTAAGSGIFVQDDLAGTNSEAFDFLGSSLTTGDFDGDGYDDLVAGAVGEDVGAVIDAGAFHFLYGSASGLTTLNNEYWTQDFLNGTSAETGDSFASSLAAGDFDGDGYDDLVAAAVNEDFGAIVDAGLINVMYGSFIGLTSSNSESWVQNDLNGSFSEGDDHFGSSLAVGDFDGDGYDDLATGAMGEDFGSVTDAGAVNIMYGSGFGLTSSGSQFWTQDSLTGSSAEAFDGFGQTLAVGDFDGDGFDDLAVGTPGEDIGTETNAGAVNVIYGSAFGLTSVGNQFWTQDNITGGNAQPFDEFGYSLSAGDYNNDGFEDLAIAAPGDGGVSNTGAVNILYGSFSGLVA